MAGDIGFDLAHEIGDATEGAATDRLVGNESEPAFHLVEPGSVSGGEVQVEAGPFREPGADFRMLMGRVVVHNQVHVQFGLEARFDVAQERQELLVSVAWLTLADDRAIGDVEGGEQGGGAMPEIIVGDAFHIAEPHGQDRLAAFQRLDLALLVHAQHQGMVRRVEIQPHDVGSVDSLKDLRRCGCSPNRLK